MVHEISNALNLAKKSTEGSLDPYDGLFEMLMTHLTKMSRDDMALLDEIYQELPGSLNPLLTNYGLVLAIMVRMRGLGLVGDEPLMTDLNAVLSDDVGGGRCRRVNGQDSNGSYEPVLTVYARERITEL